MELVTLIKNLSLSEPEDELAVLLQKLELGDDLDLADVTSRMKNCRIAWTSKIRLDNSSGGGNCVTNIPS